MLPFDNNFSTRYFRITLDTFDYILLACILNSTMNQTYLPILNVIYSAEDDDLVDEESFEEPIAEPMAEPIAEPNEPLLQ